MAGTVPHPIPYQGSKRGLAEQILRYFPADRVHRLVEPFAGSAAISLATGCRDRAERFLLNDAHRPLASLWREIIDHPERLAARYEQLWQRQLGRERSFYDEVRALFNDRQRPEHFLYLLARCVKAVVRYNSKGHFNNSPDNRRRGAKPATMRRRIMGASEILADRTAVRSADYRDIVADCTADDLVYLDPPYQGVCGKRDPRYAPTVDHDEFCAALAGLNERGCRYLVSYDGRTGTKRFGHGMPDSLQLVHVEIQAGRSSQATLLGRDQQTIESLYLSPALATEHAASGSRRGRRSVQFRSGR